MILCLTRKPAEEIVAKEMGVMEGAAPSINFHPFVVTADGNSIKDRDTRIEFDPPTSAQVGSVLNYLLNKFSDYERAISIFWHWTQRWSPANCCRDYGRR